MTREDHGDVDSKLSDCKAANGASGYSKDVYIKQEPNEPVLKDMLRLLSSTSDENPTRCRIPRPFTMTFPCYYNPDEHFGTCSAVVICPTEEIAATLLARSSSTRTDNASSMSKSPYSVNHKRASMSGKVAQGSANIKQAMAFRVTYTPGVDHPYVIEQAVSVVGIPDGLRGHLVPTIDEKFICLRGLAASHLIVAHIVWKIIEPFHEVEKETGSSVERWLVRGIGYYYTQSCPVRSQAAMLSVIQTDYENMVIEDGTTPGTAFFVQ